MRVKAFIACSIFLSINVAFAHLDAEGIIGGRDAEPLEFPYVISLRNGSGVHICGGGIIGDQYILTAAHCVLHKEVSFNDFPYTVVGGINHLEDDADTRVEIGVEKIYVPEIYNHSYWQLAKTPSGDIAVLKLKHKLDIENNPGLSILDLPEKRADQDYDSYLDATPILAGFGYDYMKVGVEGFPRGNSTGQLHKANILILDNFECKKRFKNPVLDSQICAKMIEHDDDTQQGTCYTDSGSPLVLDNTVIAVVSGSNEFCDQKFAPGLYTRVTSHLDFIRNAMKGDTDGMRVATATD